MDAVRLSHEPLDVAEIYRRVVVASCGAVSLFVGTTRDHFEGKRVVELVYEAYEAMAEKELIKICRSVRDKWKVCSWSANHYHRMNVDLKHRNQLRNKQMGSQLMWD